MTATVDIDVEIELMLDAAIITEAAQTRPDESTAVVPAIQRDGKLPEHPRGGKLPAIERDATCEVQRTGYLPEINRRERADR